MVVVGIDPGLAATGWAWLLVGSDCAPRLHSAGAILTKPTAAKLRLHSVDDTAERIRHLAHQVHDMIAIRQAESPVVVAVEAYSTPRFAAAAVKLGFAWGAVVATLRHLRVPVVQLTPQQVKKALGIRPPPRATRPRTEREKEDARQARKQLVGWRMDELMPGSRDLLAALAAGEVEHATDAAAVAYAALKTDVVWAALGRGAA
jgi:Holliday junction resolvasome RuvABC endonuclease subunit